MRSLLIGVCTCALALSACKKSAESELAPASSALSSAAPVSAKARSFGIVAQASGVGFMMDAELEKIVGRAPGSVHGELHIDFENLSKSSGLVKVDLDKLSLYKRVRDDKGAEFGTEEKSEKQNRDMRNWFQIGEDAPPEDREKFRWAEFKITSVRAAPNELRSQTSPARSVKARVSGDFRIHGRTSPKTIEAELTFSFQGDVPTRVSVKTLQAFDVGLEEHDIRPRRSFAQLADATLDALGQKVAKVAHVSLNFEATPR